MCGRYHLDPDSQRVHDIIEEMNRYAPPLSEQPKDGVINPSQIAPVILMKDGTVAVAPMKWGFPRVGGGGLVINSRSEKADYTPMFQRAARERRCLIPASGFYEWRRTPSGGKTKDKFVFTLRDAREGEIMYMAGFYGQFFGGFESGGYDGFAVLTREADEQMKPYHDRMPVILRAPALKKAWLDASVPYRELLAAFDPPPLEARPDPPPEKPDE